MLTSLFTQLIEAYTGLHFRSQHVALLEQTIQARMRALKCATPEQYYRHLISGIPSGPANFIQFSQEWQHLVQQLTTGESYFLRDQGQFQLLQQQILPELIQARRQQAANASIQPTLRIWSAGCSTGEEAYSLAMLVQQLIPDWRSWNLLILGTDINAEAIAHAQKGLYHTWSFRSMSAAMRSQYFQAERGLWQLDETLRSIGMFRLQNLVQDPFPDMQSDLYNMDLIVCRNVFIYFVPETIAAVVEKFSQTLIPGGYLITGHAELYGQDLNTLDLQVFPESVVYRRSSLANSQDKLQDLPIAPSDLLQNAEFVSAPTAMLDPACDTPVDHCSPFPISQDCSNPVQAALMAAEQQFQTSNYSEAIAIAQTALAEDPQCFELHYLIAQCYVSLENYQQAKDHAQKTAEIDALSTAPCYLLAYIARQQEQYEQAKQFLKRIIYLDPMAITAYLELSALYTQAGDSGRAAKMQKTALNLIQQLEATKGDG